MVASRGICFRYIPNQDARSRVKQIRASSTRHASGAPAHPKVAVSGDERSSKRLLYPSTGESAAPPYSRWPFRTRLGMEIDGALRIAAGVGCSARGTAVSDLLAGQCAEERVSFCCKRLWNFANGIRKAGISVQGARVMIVLGAPSCKYRPPYGRA